MSEEIILTLNNGQKCKILTEGNIENELYRFAVLLDENENETNEYFFFKVINKGEKEIMQLVQDNDKKEQLMILFTSQYTDYAESLGEE